MKQKTKRSPSLRRHALDGAARASVAALLDEVMPVAGGVVPEALTGWFDSAGMPRRLRADYANGWRVEMRFNAKGQATSTSASFRMVARR